MMAIINIINESQIECCILLWYTYILKNWNWKLIGHDWSLFEYIAHMTLEHSRY